MSTRWGTRGAVRAGRQARCAGQRQHDRGSEPADGRRRSPGGLLGAVQAEHCAEAGRAAQDEAGQGDEEEEATATLATVVLGGCALELVETHDPVGDRSVVRVLVHVLTPVLPCCPRHKCTW